MIPDPLLSIAGSLIYMQIFFIHYSITRSKQSHRFLLVILFNSGGDYFNTILFHKLILKKTQV